MKTPSCTKFLVISLMLSAIVMVTPGAQALTNPASTLVKVYEMRVSPNTNCTGSITVFKTASPTTVDLVSNPTFGFGAVPNGTYKCMMIHLDDIISFTPVANDGANCSSTTQYTRDIFRAGSTSVSPDGTTITGTGSNSAPSEDDPWAYFAIGGGPFGCMNPTTPCALGAPLVVTSNHTGTLVIDFDNRVDGSGIECDLQAPLMIFR